MAHLESPSGEFLSPRPPRPRREKMGVSITFIDSVASRLEAQSSTAPQTSPSLPALQPPAVQRVGSRLLQPPSRRVSVLTDTLHVSMPRSATSPTVDTTAPGAEAPRTPSISQLQYSLELDANLSSAMDAGPVSASWPLSEAAATSALPRSVPATARSGVGARTLPLVALPPRTTTTTQSSTRGTTLPRRREPRSGAPAHTITRAPSFAHRRQGSFQLRRGTGWGRGTGGALTPMTGTGATAMRETGGEGGGGATLTPGNVLFYATSLLQATVQRDAATPRSKLHALVDDLTSGAAGRRGAAHEGDGAVARLLATASTVGAGKDKRMQSLQRHGQMRREMHELEAHFARSVEGLQHIRQRLRRGDAAASSQSDTDAAPSSARVQSGPLRRRVGAAAGGVAKDELDRAAVLRGAFTRVAVERCYERAARDWAELQKVQLEHADVPSTLRREMEQSHAQLARARRQPRVAVAAHSVIPPHRPLAAPRPPSLQDDDVSWHTVSVSPQTSLTQHPHTPSMLIPATRRAAAAAAADEAAASPLAHHRRSVTPPHSLSHTSAPTTNSLTAPLSRTATGQLSVLQGRALGDVVGADEVVVAQRPPSASGGTTLCERQLQQLLEQSHGERVPGVRRAHASPRRRCRGRAPLPAIPGIADCAAALLRRQTVQTRVQEWALERREAATVRHTCEMLRELRPLRATLLQRDVLHGHDTRPPAEWGDARTPSSAPRVASVSSKTRFSHPMQVIERHSAIIFGAAWDRDEAARREARLQYVDLVSVLSRGGISETDWPDAEKALAHCRGLLREQPQGQSVHNFYALAAHFTLEQLVRPPVQELLRRLAALFQVSAAQFRGWSAALCERFHNAHDYEARFREVDRRVDAHGSLHGVRLRLTLHTCRGVHRVGSPRRGSASRADLTTASSSSALSATDGDAGRRGEEMYAVRLQSERELVTSAAVSAATKHTVHFDAQVVQLYLPGMDSGVQVQLLRDGSVVATGVLCAGRFADAPATPTWLPLTTSSSKVELQITVQVTP